jgi:hypothetical protein
MNSDDESSDVQFIRTKYLNNVKRSPLLDNIFCALPQGTNTTQRTRAISIDITKDNAADMFAEKSLKRKRLENSAGSHRLASVTKKV